MRELAMARGLIEGGLIFLGICLIFERLVA